MAKTDFCQLKFIPRIERTDRVFVQVFTVLLWWHDSDIVKIGSPIYVGHSKQCTTMDRRSYQSL